MISTGENASVQGCAGVVQECSGVFRGVQECSGMFRSVRSVQECKPAEAMTLGLALLPRLNLGSACTREETQYI